MRSHDSLNRPSLPGLPPRMSTADVDRIPLLEVVEDVEHRSPGHCSIDTLETEKEPSWLASYKFFLFGSWLNILLVFVPLSFLSHVLDWNVALRFSCSFLALVPLAAVRLGSGHCARSILIYTLSLFSSWERPPTRCRQNWARLFRVCSTRLSEMP